MLIPGEPQLFLSTRQQSMSFTVECRPKSGKYGQVGYKLYRSDKADAVPGRSSSPSISFPSTFPKPGRCVTGSLILVDFCV